MQIFSAQDLRDPEFDQILSFLRNGGVIGYPTDTAYGLGADPFNDAAVREIFRIKGRPETKPILLVVDSLEMAGRVARVSDEVRRLAEEFWPGPLTLVLPALESVSPLITAGTGTVGVRWPDAPMALRLIHGLDRPLTATSANRSGLPAAVTAGEVESQLAGWLDLLVDGGSLPARGGSTLLDMTTSPAVLLREGPVSFEALNAFLKGAIRR
ncbi:MAG TPA: L-threonylcarbamoyladenylate synthase [Terriglobia bacterium]|nr:L-threonylcarbamoyladenylate synthase [Terriglobia bacterium]